MPGDGRMMRAIAAIVSFGLLAGSCTVLHLMVRKHWSAITAALRGDHAPRA